MKRVYTPEVDMDNVYEFQPWLMLRAPFYSVADYNLQRLPEILKDPHFQRALWLASPVFYGIIQRKGFDYLQLNDKERHTLRKYYNRMSWRPVPFGSFASFTTLVWADDRPVQLATDDHLHVHPDILDSLAAFQPAQPHQAQAVLIKNPTLYPAGGNYRYIRTVPGTKTAYRFYIDELEAVEFNVELLAQLDRPVTAGQLEDWIMARASCPRPDAADYIRFLLEDQVLLTSTQGQVISRTFPAARILDHDQLAGLLRENPEQVYYTALEKSRLNGGPGEADRQELLRAAHILHRLAQPIRQEALQQFIANFKERFDLQKVPLLQALDPDIGFAYGDRLAGASGLLDDIRFAQPPVPLELVEWQALHQLFLRLWVNCPARGTFDPIVLRDELLVDFPESGAPPANGLAMLFTKAQGKLIIDSLAGASALPLIGRFSLFSEEIWKWCRTLTAAEQSANPEVVFADIHQLSDAHADNINLRRPLYDYEIPVNVFSEAPSAQQVQLQDLLVSVRSGELVLESRRLDKRVVPRLSTAFNYTHNELPLFRLLCDLQFQGARVSLGFGLTRLYPGLKFYPRVIYGQVILSLANWQLDKADIDGLRSGRLDAAAFRALHGLPARVKMGSADQQLVFQLDQPAEFDFLIKCLAHKDRAVLQECLTPDGAITAAGAPLNGQFAAFLTHPKPLYRRAYPAGSGEAERNFPPGSDWLFVKIYCTPLIANRLLREAIAPILQKEAQQIHTWFFIRYSDPAPHLRIRIRVKAGTTGPLLSAINHQLRVSGLADLTGKLICDTYRREIERYGAQYIDDIEAVFNAGSELALQLLAERPQPEDPAEVFGAAFYQASLMVRNFYPEPQDAIDFTGECAALFLKEFSEGKPTKLDLDKTYRQLSGQLTGWLGQTIPSEFNAQLTLLSERISGKQETVRRRMLGDLIHMQLNRAFADDQRRHELLVYYCLHKWLLSEQGRRKKTAQAG